MSNVHVEVTNDVSSVVEIPFNKLRLSKANSRKAKPDAAALKALTANIKQEGVLQNLIVEAIDDDIFAVHAGGRRFRAVGKLVEEGHFKEDFPIACRIQRAGSQSTVSLAENMHEAMHPADEFQAFHRMHKTDGLSVEAIASRFGVTTKLVKQRLRLAGVAPQIIKAYRAGDIELGVVMAFTLTESLDRQLEVFKECGSRVSEWDVRRHLSSAGASSADSVVRFVGLANYKKRGGAVSEDMFRDEITCLDGELIREMALEKLQKAAVKLRDDEGWETVEIETGHFASWEYRTLEAEPVDLPESVLTDLATTERLLDEAWEAEELEGEDGEKQELELAELEKEQTRLEAIIDEHRQFSDDQKAQSKCVITIRNGKAEILRGLVTPAAAKSAKKAAETNEPEEQAKLPESLLRDLASTRQDLAKAAMLKQDALAADLLLFALCTQVLGRAWTGDCLDLSARMTTHNSTICTGDAMADIEKARTKLSTAWLEHETPAERLAAFRKLTAKRKQALMTFVTVTVMQIGFNDLSDVVVDAMKVDFADTWRPDATFFTRLKKQQLLELAREPFGDAWVETHAKSKKGELVEWFEEFFAGKCKEDLTKDQLTFQKTWLPEGLI